MKKTNEKEFTTILSEIYPNICEEIKLSALLNFVYTKRISLETISSKITNQLNSMEVSIDLINPKFRQNERHYKAVQEDIQDILNDFDNILNKIAYSYDKKISDLILKKSELELKLMYFFVLNEYLLNINDKNKFFTSINNTINKIKGKIKKAEEHIADKKEKNEDQEEYIQNQKRIVKLQKEIKILSKNISKLNSEKEEQLYSCLEIGDKKISTKIRKPRTFTKITKFFTNRFNTYNAIQKNVIGPLEDRINEYKDNELKKYDIKIEELTLQDFKNNINDQYEKILNTNSNQKRCKALCINYR